MSLYMYSPGAFIIRLLLTKIYDFSLVKCAVYDNKCRKFFLAEFDIQNGLCRNILFICKFIIH
jgi:hypothetical protein